MNVLVDSDILIEVSRGRDAEIVARWSELSESDSSILFSPISVAELWAGARTQEDTILNNLFRTMTCATVNAEIGQRAGAYLQRFRKSHGLEIADAFIAASAAFNKAQLWTRNRKHYPMKDVTLFK